MSANTMSRLVVHLALELSVTSWVIAYRLPWSDKVRLQGVSTSDGAALLALVSDLRTKGCRTHRPRCDLGQLFRSRPRRILAASAPDR